jgi:hypothetical protein
MEIGEARRTIGGSPSKDVEDPGIGINRPRKHASQLAVERKDADSDEADAARDLKAQRNASDARNKVRRSA